MPGDKDALEKQEMGETMAQDTPEPEKEPANGAEPESPADEELQKLAGEIQRLKEENENLFARLQRLQADFDNYRKRVKAEKQEWSTQVLCDFIRDLLPVLDNLERAGKAEGPVEAVLAGVELVHKQFMSILEKEGVKVIEACGQPFDPNYHHAVAQVECDQPENTVVEELLKGYLLKDRVIRASMVKVAGQPVSTKE